ncbi:MAG: transglycosylase domain-containing protein [Dethiobacteria bacterium]
MFYFAYLVLSIDDLPEAQQALTTRFFYDDGEVLAERYVENRYKIPLEEIPLAVQWGTIAIEDRHFRKHYGIDIGGICRALLRNLRERRIVQGGSTITQQLAKNLFLSPERTWKRKIEEAALTIHLERTYTKDEILEKYLNTIYYGHAAYGIEAAARTFFAKRAKELTLAESALLVGIPRGPRYYSPFYNEEAAFRRQALVLERMEEDGYITAKEKEKALAEPLKFRSLSEEEHGLYYLEYLVSEDLKRFHEGDTDQFYRSGLQIYTTLNREMQKAAEEVIANLPVQKTDESGVRQPQGALIALDPQSGEIKAMTGGRSFEETMLNRAVPPTRRSPGSAFKPFVYAAALENGLTADSRFSCEPLSIEDPWSGELYEPTDFGNHFHWRELTMREAIKVSCNVAAIKANLLIGPEKSVEMAKKLGIKSNIQPYASLPLGTFIVSLLEMTSAYAPFANGGIRAEPIFIKKIVSPNGEILFKNKTQKEQVLDPRIAYIMTDMLKDVFAPGGTAAAIRDLINRPTAAKTGTSDSYRNVYMVGYTPDLVIGLYIGNDDEQSLEVSSGSLAVPTWGEFYRAAVRGLPVQDFPRPQGLVDVSICPETGAVQSDHCTLEGYTEIFIEGTEPGTDCAEEGCPYVRPRFWWPWPPLWNRSRAE